MVRTKSKPNLIVYIPRKPGILREEVQLSLKNRSSDIFPELHISHPSDLSCTEEILSPKMVSDRKNKKRTVASTDVDLKPIVDQNSNDEGPSPKKAKKPSVKKTAKASTKKVKKEEANPFWPEAELQELIRKIELNIPPKDGLRHNSRVERFPWESVKFGPYTAAECKLQWLLIQNRLRRFRLLKEVVEDAKLWVSQPWTNFYRSSKKNRHPDQPKRPLSTYMLYYMEKKDKVSKENPSLEMTELSQKIAAMYNNLADKQKQKYVSKAAQQRHEYDLKMEAFYAKHPELVPKVSKREKSTGQTYPGPRKPRSPFDLYFAEKLEKHKSEPDSSKTPVKDLKDQYRNQWKALSDKKKIGWINAALDDEIRYNDELRVYMEENPEFSPPPTKAVLTRSEHALKERLAGKPEKPPNSGYSLFSRIMLTSEEIKPVESKQRMTQISSMWQSLSTKDKQKYQEKVQQMLEQYKLDFATYLESLPPEKKEEELQASQRRRKPTAQISRKRKVKKEKVEEEQDDDDEDSSDLDDFAPSASKTKPAGTSGAKTKKSQKVSEKNASMKLFRGEPEPPPVMAYKLFLKSFMSEAKHIPAENRLNEAPRYWQMLPDAEKATFRKRLLELKQKYIADYEKFLKSLSQEQLKEYSQLKSNSKQSEESHGEDSDAESGSDKDDEEEEEEEDEDDVKSDEDSDSEGSSSGSASGTDNESSASASASDSDSDSD